ncbi:MAG: class I SAM-dependent methyltransferase [Akkermansiaceae bacterium]
MFPPRPTHLLHRLLEDVIQQGDRVIDATAGNGHDTVFLAEAVGAEGRVIAVDIQAEAITSTSRHLAENGLSDRVDLHQKSHTQLNQLTSQESVSAIVFNLGYLPGADHKLITKTEDTLEALSLATSLVQKNGVLCAICYPGHEGGDEEARTVEKFFGELKNFRTAKYQLLSTRHPSPFLLIALKTRSA